VSEVVGFVLTFGISAVVLVVAVQSFATAQQTTNTMLAAAEMKNVANRIATRLVQAGILYQDFPNSSTNITLTIPPTVAGKQYTAAVTPTTVYVNTTDRSANATASTFHLDAYSQTDPCFRVTGSVPSSYSSLVVRYGPVSTGTKPTLCAAYPVHTIQISGGVR
jgi:hypothetical protein